MKYNDEESIKRLIDEYEKHKKLVIGFDFDNTIFDVHNKGVNCTDVIRKLQMCKELGFILCLYTAELREDWLKWKVDYCKHFGIEPDYINESPLLQGTKKPFFNLLIDDRAGLQSSINILSNLLSYVNIKPEKSE